MSVQINMRLDDLSKLTMKQVLLASGLGRGITRTKIELDLDVSPAFITKYQKEEDIKELINMFKLLPFDEDTKEYKGISTLCMDYSRLMYNMAEKEQNVK